MILGKDKNIFLQILYFCWLKWMSCGYKRRYAPTGQQATSPGQGEPQGEPTPWVNKPHGLSPWMGKSKKQTDLAFAPSRGAPSGCFQTQGDAPFWSLCPGLMAFCPAGAMPFGQDSSEAILSQVRMLGQCLAEKNIWSHSSTSKDAPFRASLFCCIRTTFILATI